jgi:serine protease Do
METETSNTPEQNQQQMPEQPASTPDGISEQPTSMSGSVPEQPTSMPPGEPEPMMQPPPATPPPNMPPPMMTAPGGKRSGSGVLAAVLIVLLAIATMVNGGLVLQSNSKLDTTNSNLTAAQSTIASLQQTVSKLTGTTPATPATVDFITPAKMILPEVVYVEVTDRTGGATGSGTIIRSDGYVLTNQHVIAGATSISVTLSTGEKFAATLVNSNADLDAAILKLTTTRTNLPTVTMGSSASVVIGQEILTCGFPLGADLFGSATFGPATFNAGVVSAIRNLPSGNTNNPAVTLNYIQIDADINPGNSGGGLFTLDGKFIGIPAYGFATGVNAAIPIDALQSLIQSSLK